MNKKQNKKELNFEINKTPFNYVIRDKQPNDLNISQEENLKKGHVIHSKIMRAILYHLKNISKNFLLKRIFVVLMSCQIN